MTLALYGHPFSSYTWKALIALYAADIAHELRVIDDAHPDHLEAIRSAGPLGKFPVLADGDRTVFEATSIIEYLSLYHAPEFGLVPRDPQTALAVRMIDRVFDNYVMGPMQEIVNEHLRDRNRPDTARIGEARERLERTYAWLDAWLASYEAPDRVTLIECAAAPSLFYADWVVPIADRHSRLKDWRACLLLLPAVARCVEDARPFRAYFPLGAPDRD